ncbi:MAG TPA: FtsH protease activity modulator HflK [Steroidobacteraceae bacterium]
MAWNDPGRNRNPWGNRPDKGPGDLDEALRNLQRKLSQMFGGKDGGGDGGREGGGGGGFSSGAIRGFGFSTVALVLLGVWALTGFYVVDAAERGVVTRFGQYVATTEPGLRWHVPWPIEARQVINVESIEGVQEQTRMLTSDENLVDINFAVQYRRAEPVAYAFNVRDPDTTLKDVAESAIRETVGRSQLDFVLEQGRQEITAKTKELIQRTLAAYKTGIEVTTVNLQGVNVPEQVQSAQRDAIKAREDKERLGLEAQAYANDILPKAKGSAARQTEDAIAYKARIVADAEGEAQRFSQLLDSYQRAPEVTRKRLYYETIEEVLGNTNKVIVDTKGTGNMLYLPLDKMSEGRARTLTLDEQRQVPATVQPREAAAAPEVPAVSTVESRREARERGTR